MAPPSENTSNSDLNIANSDIANSDWTNLSVSDPDATNSSVTNPDAPIPRHYKITDEALLSVMLICLAGLYITLNFQL